MANDYNIPYTGMTHEELMIHLSAFWPKGLSEQPALSTHTFTNDSPGAGSVAWSGCKMEYNKRIWKITDDNTADAWIWWDFTDPNVFQTDASIPTITDDIVIIGKNDSGTFYPFWKSGGMTDIDMVVGTIVADSVVAGAIDGETITGATIRTAASGARVEMNSTDGLKAIDGSANTLVQITTAGVFTLKSGTSGARIEIDSTNGIRGYDSGGTLGWQLPPSGIIRTAIITDSTYTTTYPTIELGTANTLNLGFLGSLESLKVSRGSGYISVSSSELLSAACDLYLKAFLATDSVIITGGATTFATFTSSGLNIPSGYVYSVNSVQVVGAQGAAVADATGAGDVVAQLNALLARCRAHGLIAT